MRCPRWPVLTRYLPGGRLEIDNNIAERAIRAVETAKCNRHNPHLWLPHVLEAIGRQRESTDYDALMPWIIIPDTVTS